jgi:hypothetical protein
MSFNIVAESSSCLDYYKIHRAVYKVNLPFDFVPMPTLGPNGGDALGICVPLKNANEATWEELSPVLKILRSKFRCEVYDLYGGQKLGYFNIRSFKKNLLLK